jgi:N-acetyl-anhydromuramyl-L-alanine amidase AmpD
MIINQLQRLEKQPGDGWDLRDVRTPNVGRAIDEPMELIIHATGRASVENAESNYKKKGKGSVHLLLGKNGKELVQLVPFNRRAHSVFGHNKTSIIVGLDYYPGSSNSPDADPNSYLVVMAYNNKPYRVALFKPEQINALLDLAVFLEGSLNLTTLLSNNEINPGSSYPGLAFPLTHFREKLFDQTDKRMGAKVVLEEINTPTVLLNSPDELGVPLAKKPLPAETPVSIIRDWKDWALVEVIREFEGNPWPIGWVEKENIQAGVFEPEVRNGFLYTRDDRQYKFIPAYEKNYRKNRTRPDDDINFVVMHITTGTQVQSSIHHFQSEGSCVSAHLVIGRDGRVIQMVPFNHAAYHSGSGVWEGKGGINDHSIGIEVDNAGKLTHKRDGSYARRTTIIPEDQVEWVRHWKSSTERPWHKFSPIQLDVTKSIVVALNDHYEKIDELLEHERISLKIRSDPGPLFPMESLRKTVLDREKPIFKVYKTVRDTDLYENACYKSPDLNVTKYNGQLPECKVEILVGTCAYWTKIEVKICKKKKNKVGKKGWVRKKDVKYFRDGLYEVTRKQDFYRNTDKPPSFILQTIPAGTNVRVQKASSGWSLIATPEHEPDYIFLEGWVRSKDLMLVEG